MAAPTRPALVRSTVIRRHVKSDHPFRLAWAGVDCVVWAIALVLGSWLRYELHLESIAWRGLAITAVIAAALQLVFGFLFGPYAVGHMRGSFDEIVDLAKTVLAASLVTWVPVLIANPILVPKSVPIIAGAFALVGMLALRLLVRSWKNRRGYPGGDADYSGDRSRVVVFGAGEGGRVLVRAMVRDRNHHYHPVALLDDDPLKSRLAIEGVRVRGTRNDLEGVAARYDADTLAIAMPSADASLIQDLSDRAAMAGLNVLVLPAMSDMFATPTLGDLRDLNLADLLGRRAIQLDTTAIAERISGKRVLVTGASGFSGGGAPPEPGAPRRTVRARRLALGRHPGQGSPHGDLRPGATGHRLPRGRTQTPPATRAVPLRGLQVQCHRHPQRPRGIGRCRRQYGGQHLHR